MRGSRLKTTGVVICILLLIPMLLAGCETKTTTVADNILDEAQTEEVIEMGKFKVTQNDDDEPEDIGYCAILIPADFKESDEIPGMYISNLYPIDSSNIYYTVVDYDLAGVKGKALTQEDYKTSVEESYAAKDSTIDLQIDAFTKEELEKVPCYKIRSHFIKDGIEVQQLAYIVISSKVHIITYTQISDDELMADFLTDEGEIRLVREISQA